ncbi:uncharacterized protein LOC125656371 [Ostrea edulis]|uniref:uncharacterized protein LOC125656371 n=1 Tax=Ostrea edulis TaxID=37623 RepID=UPI0024AFD42E|nr:uncharacterized protein LOC125656371 [Ostrea edulis]
MNGKIRNKLGIIPTNVIWGDCKILGVSYLGTQNVTERGFECQAWDKQYPHRHSYGSYPGASENYCRDFDSDEPWCLTTNRKVVWDRCIVPSCGVNVTVNSSSCALINELDISELKNERSCRFYCNWIRTTINDAIAERNLQNERTCRIRDKKKIVRKHEHLLHRGTYTPWMCSISIFDGKKYGKFYQICMLFKTVQRNGFVVHMSIKGICLFLNMSELYYNYLIYLLHVNENVKVTDSDQSHNSYKNYKINSRGIITVYICTCCCSCNAGEML